MKKSDADQGQSASELISKRIADLGGWRGETLGRMRRLLQEVDPEVVEEWKWMGTPVWSRNGMICTGESYEAAVKLTFAKGAALASSSDSPCVRCGGATTTMRRPWIASPASARATERNSAAAVGNIAVA